MAETSDRVSSIAGRMNNLSPETVRLAVSDPIALDGFVRDIRSMAASLLRQDQTKGLRAKFRKLIGG